MSELEIFNSNVPAFKVNTRSDSRFDHTAKDMPRTAATTSTHETSIKVIRFVLVMRYALLHIVRNLAAAVSDSVARKSIFADSN